MFCHHRLLVRGDGAKLSKSNGDAGVRDLRARGLSAGEVLGRTAFEADLQARPNPIGAEALPRLFDRPDRCE